MARGAARKAPSERMIWRWMGVGIAAAGLLQYTPWLQRVLASMHAGNVAASKPYADIAAFFPYYLREHQQVMTVRLHVLGTSIALLLLLRDPVLLAAGCMAILSGRIAFSAFRYCETGWAEAAVAIGVFATTIKLLGGRVRGAIGMLVVFYGLAWIGHYCFEHNQPATFVYPTFSMVCDWIMWAEYVFGIKISM